MNDPTLPLSGLSPVSGKNVVAKFDGGLLSSDGGVLLLREIEQRLRVAERLAGCIRDPRNPDLVTHTLADIIRFRLLMIGAGYEDGNYAGSLRVDPIFKMAQGVAPSDHELASQSTISRFEDLPDARALLLLESRQAAAALKIQRNKTDRSDAYGLAQLVRTGWFRPVHVKSVDSHRLRLLLTHRRTLKRKLVDIENEVRQSLKVFGLMLGPRVQRSSFEARVRALVAHDRLIAGVTECMQRAWSTLWSECKRLHTLLVQFVGRDELCRRFMAIPGVGPVTALSFKAAVDDPTRFAKSKTVGAYFGLTSRRIQSGDTIDIDGHISKCGDGEVRTALYEAASAMLVRSKKWCAVKAWGVKIAAKRGHKRAVVAVARKLAVIMHRMWIDGSAFRFSAQEESSGSPKRGAKRTLAIVS